MKKQITQFIGLFLLALCFQGYAQESKSEKYLKAIKEHMASMSQEKSLLSSELLKVTDPTLTKEAIKELTSAWIMKDDMVKIMARCKENKAIDLKLELEAVGMQKAKIYGSIISGWMPLTKLAKMEQCTFLRKASPEYAPKANVGSVDSEAALRTKFLATSFGLDGTGIKIGIMSNSFNTQGGYADGVASGDLPGPGNPNGYTKEVQILSEGSPSNDEGRAMAELIHDIAPGAELFYYGVADGFFDFPEGIRALADAGCDILVDDIGYFAAPVFQDGLISQAVNEVKERGIVYFSSAGNSSDEAVLGRVNENQQTSDEDEIELLEFEDGNVLATVDMFRNATVDLWIHWDDNSLLANDEGAKSDLNIAIFNKETGELAALSEFNNLENGVSFETIRFTSTLDGFTEYEIAIVKTAGPTPSAVYLFDRIGVRSTVNFIGGLSAPTVTGHPNAAGAIAVGASSFFNTQDFGQTENIINSFSSLGGIPTLLDPAGNRIPQEIRQKPDVVGMDAVSNTFFGNDFDLNGIPNFGGTSAAAPNVAALAALMLQLQPDLTPDEIKELLISTASDMDDPATEEFDEGFDFKTGFGYVNGDTVLATMADFTSVYRFELLDGNTGELVQVLNEGANIDLATDEGRGFYNVRALTLQEDPLFVKLKLSGRQLDIGIDRQAPYLLNREGSRIWEAKTGDFSIEGQVFSRFVGSTNAAPPTQTVNFSVINSVFVQDIKVVENGVSFQKAATFSALDRLDLDISGLTADQLENLNIEPFVAYSLGAPRFGAPNPFFEEIAYKITGPNISYERTVSNEDFKAFVDEEGAISTWFPTPVNGEYTIETTVFARAGDPDTAGETTSLVVNVIVPELEETETAAKITAAQDAKGVFNMAPNPATSMVNVAVASEKRLIALSLYDSHGRKVYSNEGDISGTMQIDISQFTKGLYVLSGMDANGKQFSKKLLVQ